jgi:hypothetical protein
LTNNLAGQIRKESHFSENLDGKYFHEEQKYLKKILDSKKNLPSSSLFLNKTDVVFAKEKLSSIEIEL